MTFAEYLVSKKIDQDAFIRHEPERFRAWETLFGQMHPESFTTEKKFLINEIRRKYRMPVPPVA